MARRGRPLVNEENKTKGNEPDLLGMGNHLQDEEEDEHGMPAMGQCYEQEWGSSFI